MKKAVQAMFSDREWDADGCKIAGFIIAIWGCVLASFGNELGERLVWAGGAMMGVKAWRENT